MNGRGLGADRLVHLRATSRGAAIIGGCGTTRGWSSRGRVLGVHCRATPCRFAAAAARASRLCGHERHAVFLSPINPSNGSLQERITATQQVDFDATRSQVFTSWHRKFTCGNATVTAFDRVSGPLRWLSVELGAQSIEFSQESLTSVFIYHRTGLDEILPQIKPRRDGQFGINARRAH